MENIDELKWQIRKQYKPAPDKGYRELLYWLYDGKCAYCRKKVNKSFHADHMKSYYYGGHTTINNMCVSCPACNKAKGTDDWSHKYHKPNKIKLVISYIDYVKHFKIIHLL